MNQATTKRPISDEMSYAASKLSNGTSLFLGHVDGRCIAARRWRDLYEMLVGVLGLDTITEPQKMLIRRAASLAVMCELEEARLARGEDVDSLAFVRLCGCLTRMLLRLGLTVSIEDEADDVAENIDDPEPPGLGEYLEGIGG